jgi:anti-sigma factor (TIGR02949 family)
MNEHCKECLQRISEYLDGDLDHLMCEKIERHLRQCPGCRQDFDSLKKSIDLCQDYAREEMPIHIRERLRSTLREVLNGRRR